MIDPRIQSSIAAALSAFSEYQPVDAATITDRFLSVFSTDKDFMAKAQDMDAVFDDVATIEPLREVFFDLLMANFFIADVGRLEEDYLDTKEWADIEEKTLERGTELLNLLLYLAECEEEEIEPELEDYLKEFLLVDDDEFQDEYRIYEPVIENQILMESPLTEVAKVANSLPEDTELKELFYPLMAFFQNPDASEVSRKEIAQHAIDRPFDMAVYGILTNFN